MMQIADTMTDLGLEPGNWHSEVVLWINGSDAIVDRSQWQT